MLLRIKTLHSLLLVDLIKHAHLGLHVVSLSLLLIFHQLVHELFGLYLLVEES